MLSKLKQLLDSNRSVRYILSGGISFVTENVIFYLFFYLFLSPVRAANVISILVALVVNFLLNKFYVFKNNTVKRTVQLVQYVILVAINLLVSTFLVGLMVDAGLSGIIAKPLVTALIISWTYVIYKKVIFRDKVN